MSLFLLAAGALGAFVYLCYSKTPYLEGKGKQTDNPVRDLTNFVAHYADPTDTWMNPNNLTTNKDKSRGGFGELKREFGPMGIPRVYYEGPGNSKLVLYGDNYTAL